LSDAALLERFAVRHEESAFAEILHRHGRMVLGVCLNILQNWHEAEDAFQATFLILARRARSGHWQASIGNWLYTVAGRVARKAKARSARCRPQQELVESRSAQESAAGETRPGDLQQLLLEELNRLPDRYRLPLVLCYLEGKTNQEAADDLGCSLGAVWSNLSRGRNLLRARLSRHGALLGAALFALFLGRDAAAAATAALVERTSRAALLFASGKTVAQTLASSNALRLAAGVSTLMTVHKFTFVAAVAILLSAVCRQAGLALLAGPGPAVEKAAPPVVVKPPERPRPAEAVKEPEPPETPRPRVSRVPGVEDPAVKAGLEWLAKQQQPDGRWVLPRTTKNDVAATAMALLPLLQAGAARKGSPAEKLHGKTVAKGLAFLLHEQKADGGFDPLMYAHGLASMAMSEACGQSTSREYRKSAEKALEYIRQGQVGSGGWGYRAGQPRADSSISIWQALALEAGKQAGLDGLPMGRQKYERFLDSVAAGGGRYGYVGPQPGSSAVTVSCLLGRRLSGWAPSRPELAAGIEYIRATHTGSMSEGCYYYYPATLLMNSLGADTLRWNRDLRATLLPRQQADGGWDEKQDRWGPTVGGRLMVTSFSLLSLQAKAAYVPLAEAPKELTEKGVEQLWNDLAGDDVARVALAMRTLAAVPERFVPLFRKQRRPLPAVPEARRPDKLIADLESEDFVTRQKAEGELAELGEQVKGRLEKVLEGRPALELRRCVQRLLDWVDETNLQPARLRELRAVRVLEYADTAESRKMLKTLAEGVPGTMLTEEAEAALARLAGKADKR
jgi:RNA polymerase sigma factor (sigma-70 family)